MKAVIAYEKRLNCSAFVPRATKLSEELEIKRKVIVKSFSIAKDIYKSDSQMVPDLSCELEAGANFLQVIQKLNLSEQITLPDKWFRLI